MTRFAKLKLKLTPMGQFCVVVLSLLSGSCLALSGQNQVLKLTDVLQSVNRHYPQIKIACLEIAKAQGAFIEAKGKFDPSIEANSSSQPMGGYINNYGDTQLNIPTLYNGIKLFAGYRNGEGNWPIYYQNYLTNSSGEYRAGLSFPLLKDRLIDNERSNLLTSRETIRAKQQTAEAVKIQIYQETIAAYWQWVEAGQQLKTLNKLLSLAKTRQTAIEKQAHLGDLPKLAITENLQQIYQRKQLVNQGRNLFEQAAVQLSLYYRDNQGNPQLPGQGLLPQRVPDRPFSLAKSNAQLGEHPELRSLAHYSRIMKIKRRQAQNELLPMLNAKAYTFKQNGTGGYPQLIPQAAMVGLSFNFPLYQREAKGRLITAQNELIRIGTEKNFVFDKLKNELTKMAIAIQRGKQQVLFLRTELGLAKKMENAETQKFFEGDSTLFLVNQREQSAAQVQLNTIHAEVELEKLKDKARFFSSTKT